MRFGNINYQATILYFQRITDNKFFCIKGQCSYDPNSDEKALKNFQERPKNFNYKYQYQNQACHSSKKSLRSETAEETSLLFTTGRNKVINSFQNCGPIFLKPYSN